jgi:hypothetical protein
MASRTPTERHLGHGQTYYLLTDKLTDGAVCKNWVASTTNAATHCATM